MKKILLAASACLIAGMCASACMNGTDTGISPDEDDKKVVMTVGSDEVEYQELRYFFMSNKADIYGASASLDADKTAHILALAENNIRDRHALERMAEDCGAVVTDEEVKAVHEYVNGYRDSNFGSTDDYALWLDTNYLTDNFYRELIKDEYLRAAVVDKLHELGELPPADESFEKILESDEIICIKEIYIPYTSESDRADAEKRAEAAIAGLMTGKSFEEMMRKYSMYNAAQMPIEHGRYTMKYDALDVIWDAASKLAVGEYSYAIEEDGAFYIVMRCEKDSDYMMRHFEDIYESYIYARLNEMHGRLADSLDIVYTEYGASLDLAGIS